MLERLKEAVRPYYLRWIHFRLHPERRPEAFRRCWTYPFQRFPAPAGAVEPGRGRPGVLLFPMIDWSQRIQRTQQLARAFARQGRACVYLNPHLGRQYESLHVFDPSPRIARLEENILEYHPRLPREPVFHARRLGAGESASLHRGFEALLAALAPAGAFQLVSLPLWMGVCLALRESHGYPIVYDCHDLLEGFGNVAPELVRDEAELMLRADRVLFSSEPLREHHLRRHPELASKALLVRNAGGLVAPESFGADARRRERPVVGYVGAIEAWFDVETMR
ncbi:MAG: hypothetical protein NTY38_22505, partial [Acidobacteria bacterium]|nr:hypothetical protein [Acidobacteriota bacterium]